MSDSRYRWLVLTLGALTHTLVNGAPTMALSVLLPEIARDFNLNLVEIGAIWGFSSLTGILPALMGGTLGDRFGAKRTLAIACILAGVLGAMRGLATSFAVLTFTTLLFGLIPSAIPTNVHKTCGLWFSGPRLGMANGVVSTGMALGFMLGSMLSATVLSPWLGGWRNVLIFYGVVAVAIGLIWSTTRPAPAATRAKAVEPVSIRRGLSHVVQIRSIWLVALAMLGIGGCIQGTLGYLPTYLRSIGWPGPAADSALAAFHGASLLCTIPIAMLSDRLGVRQPILIGAACMIAGGIGLLAIFTGPAVWLAVVLAGMVRDGFMAVLMTSIIETPGIGSRWAATATGIVMSSSMIASVVSPLAGNSLAVLGPSVPFLFWSVLGFLGVAALAWRRQASAVPVQG